MDLIVVTVIQEVKNIRYYENQGITLRTMADRLEQNESRPIEINISLPLAA